MHCARPAAIARYAQADHSDADHLIVITSIQQLSEQFEREARWHREALRADCASRLSWHGDPFGASSAVCH